MLIDREDPIPEAVVMARNMGVAFDDDRRVWHAKSPLDKVILVYNQPLRVNDTIGEYTTQASVDFQPETCVGYVQIYCQSSNVKIGKFQFQDNINQIDYWRMFKQYLIQTIRNTNTTPFTLYWERRLMNANTQRIAQEAGLLSNRNNMTYTFQNSDLGVQNNWTTTFNNSFGTTSWNNNSWGSLWPRQS